MRPGRLDKQAIDPNVFPFDAFRVDSDPQVNPDLYLENPWRFRNLHLRGTVSQVLSGTYTFTDADGLAVGRFDPNGATRIVYLPVAANNIGRAITIVKSVSSSYNLTVTRQGSDTIDGATTYTINRQYQGVTFLATASLTWTVIAGGGKDIVYQA